MQCRRSHASALLLLAVACVLVPSSAFDPALGHIPATIDALTSLGFCDKIAEQVGQENKQTDFWEALVPEAHCDGDTIVECHARILRLRQTVVDRLENYQPGSFASITDSPWEALGQALHTLQDFYSHSN